MNRLLRIGLVLPATPAYSETFFQAKINGLMQAGHEVVLFVGSSDDGFDLCPVILHPRVYRFLPWQVAAMALELGRLLVINPKAVLRFFRLDRRSGRSLREALENLYLNSRILSHRLDWLHFGFATMGLRRENTARAVGARMAVSLRGYDIAIYPLKHPGCYDLLWKRVDKVHTISNALLQLAYAQGLPKEVPAVKITPAISVEQFCRNASVPEASQRPFRLLTVARLKWVKGLEYTLQGLALLHRQGVAFRYTIIGSGEDYERLVFAAHQLGIREQVEFAGKKSHAEVKAAMENADIYLQYSISEGFCNSVLEAQAMGLLCIVSDAEGLPENVLHERTGWVVPKRQPELLVKQIVDLIHKPVEELQAIRASAIERVRREFALEDQVQAFTRFYGAN